MKVDYETNNLLESSSEVAYIHCKCVGVDVI